MTAKKKKKTLSPSEKSNREILRFTYVIVFLFLCMIGYEGFFLSQKRDEIINNTYNSRLDSFADRVIRGDILSSDGQILAQTQQQEDGTELRSYPYGDLFAHVIGYSSMGKTGLEAQGNFYMLSSHINLMEQVMREFSGQKNPGDDLYTTLIWSFRKLPVMRWETGKVRWWSWSRIRDGSWRWFPNQRMIRIRCRTSGIPCGQIQSPGF